MSLAANSLSLSRWIPSPAQSHVIREFSKCDFGPIKAWVEADRERKKAERKTPEYRKKAKEEKTRLDAIYGCAIVDGFKENVGNYKVRPAHPSLPRSLTPSAALLCSSPLCSARVGALLHPPS